jgi:hypothetical protein
LALCLLVRLDIAQALASTQLSHEQSNELIPPAGGAQSLADMVLFC